MGPPRIERLAVEVTVHQFFFVVQEVLVLCDAAVALVNRAPVGSMYQPNLEAGHRVDHRPGALQRKLDEKLGTDLVPARG